ncbi:MAG: hypothetical protein ACRD0H_12385, partial [Actinomycetes bacterium]
VGKHTEPLLAIGGLNGTQLTVTAGGTCAAAASARYRRRTYGVAAAWGPGHGAPNLPCDACRASMSQISSGPPSTR